MEQAIELRKEGLSFHKRWFKSNMFFVAFFPVFIVSPVIGGLLAADSFILFLSLAMASFMGLIYGIKVFLSRRQYQNFITHIRLNSKEVQISFQNKDAPLQKNVAVEDLVARLSRKPGNGASYLLLTLLENNTVFLRQACCDAWANADIWRLYEAIQTSKGVPLTSNDKALYRICVEGRQW